MRKLAITFSIPLLVCLGIAAAKEDKAASNSLELPPLETFILEPVQLENISVWVPAGKIGPTINRSCRPKEDCSYTCVLPASVEHEKNNSCPEEAARLLAEHTACFHEESLPLTIFNGWRWEYTYSLSQFESGVYALPSRGGCWENSWEAVLTESVGSMGMQRLRITSSAELAGEATQSDVQTSIQVKTFDSMRTRDGYPKERKLQ